MSDVGLSNDQLLIGTANRAGIYLAEIGTPPPATLTAEFANPWVSLGYASEDGPTISTSTDSEDIRGWQSVSVLRTLITGRTVTVQFALMQWNALNMSLYWDIDPVTPEADGSFNYSVRGDQAGRRHSLGVDLKDGDNLLRLVFPRVQLNAAGDMQFQRGAAAMLDVTFSCLESEGRYVDVSGKIASPNGATPVSLSAPVASAFAEPIGSV